MKRSQKNIKLKKKNCGHELKTRGGDTQIHGRYMRASVVNKSKEKQRDYLFTRKIKKQIG